MSDPILKIGDLVEVDEVPTVIQSSEWIKGSWLGQISSINAEGDKWVMPVGAFTPNVSLEDEEALYLTYADKITLLASAKLTYPKRIGRLAFLPTIPEHLSLLHKISLRHTISEDEFPELFKETYNEEPITASILVKALHCHGILTFKNYQFSLSKKAQLALNELVDWRKHDPLPWIMRLTHCFEHNYDLAIWDDCGVWNKDKGFHHEFIERVSERAHDIIVLFIENLWSWKDPNYPVKENPQLFLRKCVKVIQQIIPHAEWAGILSRLSQASANECAKIIKGNDENI